MYFTYGKRIYRDISLSYHTNGGYSRDIRSNKVTEIETYNTITLYFLGYHISFHFNHNTLKFKNP